MTLFCPEVPINSSNKSRALNGVWGEVDNRRQSHNICAGGEAELEEGMVIFQGSPCLMEQSIFK